MTARPNVATRVVSDVGLTDRITRNVSGHDVVRQGRSQILSFTEDGVGHLHFPLVLIFRHLTNLPNGGHRVTAVQFS